MLILSLGLQHIPKAKDTSYIIKCYYSSRPRPKGPDAKIGAGYEAAAKIMASRL